MFITPALAGEWLARPAKYQRSRAIATVATYAGDMLSGAWNSHIAPAILIDTSGGVLDGRHRLQAIVDSRTGIWSYVVFDVDESYFSIVDSGRPRLATQFISGRNPVMRAAASGLIGLGADPANWTRKGSSPKLPMARILEINNEWEEELSALALDMRHVYEATRINIAMHTALLAQVWRAKELREVIPQWVDGLVTGANLTLNDPRLVLRRAWLERYGELGRDKKKGGVYIIKAWNAYIAGEPLKLLRFNETELVVLRVTRTKGRHSSGAEWADA
jgi:hypothetical protein